MSGFEIIREGIIYRNPNPGYRYVYASHSHPVQLSETELLCSYVKGQAMYATDLSFALARSVDGGGTWCEEKPIVDKSRELLPYSYHDPFLTRMSDGSLVIAAFRVDRSDPDRPMFNEETGGLTETETILIRSGDNGGTWSEPEVVFLPGDRIITPASTLLELADGRWFLAFDEWHAFNDPGPYRPRMWAYLSSDRGRTWGSAVPFNDCSAHNKGHWHGKIIRLDDDRLYSLAWSADMVTHENLPLYCAFGSSDGSEWSEPQPTNIPGQTNWPVDLGNGRMAAIYTRRDIDDPGFLVTLSEDGGRTWDLDSQLRVWDATGRDKLGVNSLDSYPRSHDTIAFGAPTAMRLANGDLYCSFWCTEMSVTHIRYVQLRVAE